MLSDSTADSSFTVTMFASLVEQAPHHTTTWKVTLVLDVLLIIIDQVDLYAVACIHKGLLIYELQ